MPENEKPPARRVDFYSEIPKILVQRFGLSLRGGLMLQKIVTEMLARESAGAFRLFSFPHTENDLIVPVLGMGVFAKDTARRVVWFREFLSSAH